MPGAIWDQAPVGDTVVLSDDNYGVLTGNTSSVESLRHPQT